MIKTGPKYIDYPSLRWNATWCKRCFICVEACPQQALELTSDGVIEIADRCIRCGLCERQCPDLAIEVTAQPSKEQKNEEAD
jgi:NAD-dependent dihydropyrimidine dehydrogenase PreA subunit